MSRPKCFVCAYDPETKELDEIVSTGQEPQIVRVPGTYWHGFKAIGDELAWLLYFMNRLYNYDDPDEERRPWNDPVIALNSINGGTDDTRVGKPWNWNHPPYK